MSYRIVSWTRIERAGRDARPTIPAGLLSATARIDMTVRTTRRPLYAAGKFDRAAIMQAAAKAAHAHQDRFGGTWQVTSARTRTPASCGRGSGPR